MGIPLIGEILGIAGKAIDKIWPDASTKEQAKSDFQIALLKQAMDENSLLFQDTEGARAAYIEELRAANTPSWARAIQVLGRQFALYATVSLYVWSKISVTLKLPAIPLNDRDYYLIGVVFVFLFGARTIEKLRGVDKN